MTTSYSLHAAFMSFSYALLNTGTRLVILGVLVAMHGKWDSAVLDHGRFVVGYACWMGEGRREWRGFRGRDREAGGWFWRAGTIVLHV